MVVLKRMVGRMVIAVLTGLPVTTAMCFALCGAPAQAARPTPETRHAEHHHRGGHEPQAPSTAAAVDTSVEAAGVAVHGVPCGTYDSVAVAAIVVSSRSGGAITAASQQQTVAWGSTGYVDRGAPPDIRPASTGSSPPGLPASPSLTLPLRI